MIIIDVQINNWKPPGGEWWAGVESQPDEPLIDATIRMTISHREYRELLDRSDETAESMEQTR